MFCFAYLDFSFAFKDCINDTKKEKLKESTIQYKNSIRKNRVLFTSDY